MSIKKITFANTLERKRGGGEEIYLSIFLNRKIELILIQTK